MIDNNSLDLAINEYFLDALVAFAFG